MLAAAQRAGLSSLGLKPVAAGAELTKDGWRNEDALALMAASSLQLAYESVNPLCLPLAASPHLAARAANRIIDIATLTTAVQIEAERVDFTLVEGAGGWLTPLSEQESMADLASALQLPVILVVGVRLGCLNHTLLTAQAIRASGLSLAGWIANDLGRSSNHLPEQVDYLTHKLQRPPLAISPWQQPPDAVQALELLGVLPRRSLGPPT